MIMFDGVLLSSSRSLPELLRFARKVGLKETWLQKEDENGALYFRTTTDRMQMKVVEAGAKFTPMETLFERAIKDELPEIKVPLKKRIAFNTAHRKGQKVGSVGKGKREIVQPGASKRAEFRPIAPKRRKTGELSFFRGLWNSRPHISFLDGKPLGRFDIRFCSHVLPKSVYPKYRLNPDNLIFISSDQHRAFDQGSKLERDNRAIALGEDWDKLYRLREKLRSEYQALSVSKPISSSA